MTDKEILFEEICKRDGRIVPFEMSKITQAIFAAARAVGGEDYFLAERITDEVIRFLAARKLPGVIPAVEEIQDVVEKVLIERGHARTAKAYILYRASRTRIREAHSALTDVVKEILLEEHNGLEKERGRYSPVEKMHHIALAASQKYYLDNLLPPEISEAHIQGSFHIHQLGYYSKTLDSLQLDLYPLLRQGYGTAEKIAPGDLLETMLRMVLIFQRSHNDLAGELNIPAFDTVMGKLLRSDGRKRGGMPADTLKVFIDYLRALQTCGGSALNLSIAFGLDTTEEGMAVAQTLLLELAKKAAPKSGLRFIFMLEKGINMADTDPGYALNRLALQASLRGANLAFCLIDPSEHHTSGKGTGYFSSGLLIGENRHGARGGAGRGNIASLTINLPRLALLARDEELFFVELDRLLRLAVRQLLHRFEVLTALKCQDLPFVMGAHLYRGSENLAAADSIKESLEQGQMTLCFCGMREAISILGKDPLDPKGDGKRLYLRILEHMARRVDSFAAEYDLNIALSGAVEAVKTRPFVQKDRQDFGLVKGVTDRELYCNGFHLFLEDEGLADKMEWEGELHRYCTAGYLSKAVYFPGLEPEGMTDFIGRLSNAGIKFFHLSGVTDQFAS